MSKPLLSIQIPYTMERYEDMRKLLNECIRQIKLYQLDDAVIMEFDDTGKETTIGEKRELMYARSTALFSWQIDSDDWIHMEALKLITDAINANPDIDCITFEEHIDIDGKIQRSNHSLRYNDWDNNVDGYDYVRTPFMKSVIKTEIAKSVPVPHIRFGEDHQWAQALKQHLITEIHISEQIYHYIHRSSNPEERYGLDRK